MKIYIIQAKITDVYRGDKSYRFFNCYKKPEKAEIDLKKLKDKWGKYKDCYAVFSIKEIEVIE